MQSPTLAAHPTGLQEHTQAPTTRTPSQPLDRRRYRRTLRFFGGVVASLVWWEIVVRRTLGRRAASRNRSARMIGYARDFRRLAVDMGGVMIKLGQFFSARVDVLPDDITRELAGLQDEVPPDPFAALKPTLEAELGPLEKTFAWFDTEAHAAASLGQVYRAQLHGGDRVVVKVLRPDIEDVVATDLSALNVVGGWAMRYKPIRLRADVPALLDEFARTLWEELDYVAEANNARRFGEIFADDPGVYVPAVYDDYSKQRVLTLEDVTSIKITDHAAIEAAGVDRRQAAQRLFGLYLEQIFEHRFFHADPHPGNLFVYPLPGESNGARGAGREFYLVFVDFGMVGSVSDGVVEALSESLRAIGTRDMRRLVKANQMMGVLLPHADVERIAEAQQVMFDRVWGMNIRQLRDMQMDQMREFMREFSDLLFEMPFQVPQDMIYLGRAMSILSGMCTSLDPEFNPWTQLAPYAQKLVVEEARNNAGTLLQQVGNAARFVFTLPGLAQEVLSRAERGDLRVRTAPDTEARRQQRRLEKAIGQLATGLVFASLTLAATLLLVNGERLLGGVGFGLAGLSLLAFVWRQVRR